MKFPFIRPRARGAADRKAMPEFKALAQIFAGGESAGDGAPRGYAGLAREGYLRNPVAHRAVRLVSEAAASVPWLAYRDGAEDPEHAALALFRQPNGRQAGGEFFEALYEQLLISGNAFLLPVTAGTRLMELHLLRPDRVRLVEGSDGWVEAVEYRAGSRVRRYPASGAGAVLQLKLFHPLDDHLGFPPLAAAGAALDLANSASRWNRALIDNSARPSGALVYQPKEGGNLSADQYDRLKTELDEGYSGPMRAGRPLLLDSDAYL